MATKKKAKRKLKKVAVPKVEAPYVEIVGSDVDPRKGIQISLDWNDAFIDYLRKNGFTGTSEEAVVQLWITHLYKNMTETMAEKKINEFE